MPTISKVALDFFRARTFHTAAGLRVTSVEGALDFINERGFAFFWPIKNVLCPSLWVAAAGDRPVADEHDDPGHVTWGWKDSLLGKRSVYYARVIKHRNTFVSFALLPAFYALSPNYGSPEEDYLIDYESGQMTAEAKTVYECLLQNGPMDTVALRKAAHLSSRTSDGPFNKALDDLQVSFRILPVGVAEAGAWKYAFVYDITGRYYPDVIEQAHAYSEWDARRALILSYLQSVGAARPIEVARLFGWPLAHLEKATRKLIDSGQLCSGIEIEDLPGEYLALPNLL
jgi:hypothetical protein